jgi:flagellar motor switch protein FliN/FliY
MNDKKTKSPNEAMKIQNVQFSPFPAEAQRQADHHRLDLLSDIPVQVSVELGRTKKRVGDILGLEPGSVLVIDKLAGEPVDVLVNQNQIAIGEVVVVDDNFSVRITDIISQQDRMKKLK